MNTNIDSSKPSVANPKDIESGGSKVKVSATTSDDLSLLSSQEHQVAVAESNTNDGAEGIVRAEAKTVQKLRAALIFVIVAAATGCGFLIYKLSSKNETDSFEQSFGEAASKFSQAFVEKFAANLNYAFVMSVSLSSRLYADSDYVPSFPNVSIHQLEILARGLTDRGGIHDIIWSPLLRKRKERVAWEAYALSKMSNLSGSSFPPCYVCGEGYDLVHPDTKITIPGAGAVQCRLVNEALIAGYISPDQCAYATRVVPPVCGCQKSSSQDSKSNSSANQGLNRIFRLEDGAAVVDHGPPPYLPVWQISPSLNAQKAVMFNQMSEPWRRAAVNNMLERKTPVYSKTYNRSQEGLYKLYNLPATGVRATIVYPVFESLTSEEVVGSLVLDLNWDGYFNNIYRSTLMAS